MNFWGEMIHNSNVIITEKIDQYLKNQGFEITNLKIEDDETGFYREVYPDSKDTAIKLIIHVNRKRIFAYKKYINSWGSVTIDTYLWEFPNTIHMTTIESFNKYLINLFEFTLDEMGENYDRYLVNNKN